MSTDKVDFTSRKTKGGPNTPVRAAPAGVIMSGQVTVTTAGTSVALAPSYNLEAGVRIKANSGNAGNIFVGPPTVNVNNGYLLDANEEVFIETANLNYVWLDTDNSGDGVSYLAS
jgi:hypothetical protein